MADLNHETRRCPQLTHPSIVRVPDFVQADGLAEGLFVAFNRFFAMWTSSTMRAAQVSPSQD